jgi:PhoH-like ATPase
MISKAHKCKTFVLDTTVLLYDPGAIQKFGNNDVVIPIIVLEELNSLKRNTDEVGKHARQVMRYIDSLKEQDSKDFSRGIKIKEGPLVRIFLSSKICRENGFPLSLDKNSNKIIHAAYLLSKEEKRVVFVSKDFASRIKAEALGLVAEDYENLKVYYEDMYRGIRKLNVSKESIDLFNKNGFLEEKGEFFANEYCQLVSVENSSAICKYNKDRNRLENISFKKTELWGLQPLNAEQKCAIDLLLNDNIQLATLVGPAGTGKTLLAVACAMNKVFHEASYSRILISRPIVPLGKDIGYLPGTKEEKLYHWMQPIYDNLEFLCQSSTSEVKTTMQWIMESQKIEMEAVTYVRGRSLPKMYMIVDEAQNLTPHEVKTIISRAAKGTKVVLTGDPTQIDNPYLDQDSNGLTYTVSKFKGQKIFGHVFLDKTERSPLAAIATEIM